MYWITCCRASTNCWSLLCSSLLIASICKVLQNMCTRIIWWSSDRQIHSYNTVYLACSDIKIGNHSKSIANRNMTISNNGNDAKLCVTKSYEAIVIHIYIYIYIYIYAGTTYTHPQYTCMF